MCPRGVRLDDSGAGVVLQPDVPSELSERAITGCAELPGTSHHRQTKRGVVVKTEAAILWGLNEPWSVEEIELDAPARR